MELIRKILFAIEEKYVDSAIYDLEIDGYDLKSIAYHCLILKDAGLVCDYDAIFGGDELLDFGVGALTWEGHDFLDKIRNDTIWNKTKETIKSKGLPMILDVVKSVSSAIVSGIVNGVINGH